MHEVRPAKITSPIVSLKDSYQRIRIIGLVLAVIGFGIGIAYCMAIRGGDDGLVRLKYAYLTSYCALLSMCVGCLFFVIIMHLTRAGWSVSVRRIAEMGSMCILPLFLLFLPILIPLLLNGDSDVYRWNQEGWTIHGDSAQILTDNYAEGDVPPLEELKRKFLNPTFFSIRIVLYFAIWGTMAWFFYSRSRKQDETGDKNISLRMQAVSAPGMIIFASTLVFASFDMEMTLAPLWFSTMFPVYYFAGAMLSALAVISLIAMLIQRSGRVTDEITVEHYHDLAKLMFSFIFFWGYIAFGQFMLIWYANIPEETFWFAWRINPSIAADGTREWTGWQTMSLILLFGHLLIPFLALMARTVRRNRTYMFFASIYILAIHWFDHYWIIMPQYQANFESETHHGHATGLQSTFDFLADVPIAVGMIGVFVVLFCTVAGSNPLIPLKDPRLGECLNFKNL